MTDRLLLIRMIRVIHQVILTMFFKLLGIILFAVEIIWFIGLPVYREGLVWWQRRGEIKHQRQALFSLSVVGVTLMLLVLPLSRSVNVAAIIVAEKQAQYYAPVAAQIKHIAVAPGDVVQAGDILVRLSLPVYTQAQLRARLRLALVEKRLARGGADAGERALRVVLEGEKSALEGELEGLAAKVRKLTLRAGFDGVVSEVPHGLHQGMWVNQDLRLVHLVAKNSGLVAHGLVYETDVERLTPGNAGVFISENGVPEKLAIKVKSIGLGIGGEKGQQDQGAGRVLAYLSVENNGPIVLTRGAGKDARSAEGLFPVLFSVQAGNGQRWMHEQRGTVVVKGQAQSVLGRFFRHALSVLLHETGL